MSETIKTIGVLTFRNNLAELLMVRHTKKAEHISGRYGVPAGRQNPGETDIQTALRELHEETGFTAQSEDLIELPTVYNEIIPTKEGPKPFSMKVFLCKNLTGKSKDSEENLVEWVSIDGVKTLNLLPNIENIVNEGLKFSK